MSEKSANFPEIQRKISNFAQSEIYPRRNELISTDVFPSDIWHQLGDLKLLDLTLSTKAGGAGLTFTELAKLAETLNSQGGVPGLTMSLMTHWMFLKLHLEPNLPEDLKKSLLPLFGSGAATISVAISEPGVGAHPKHLKSTISPEGDQLMLNGEKTFLTNGPIATHFLILAISSETEGQKNYSAVLTPANSDGLSKTAGMKLDFLHPCPHGGIKFKNVKVPASHLLGIKGDGYRQFSLSTRHVEDAIGAAAMQGSLTALLREVAAVASDDDNADIGAIAARIEGLSPLASTLAEMAETKNKQMGDMYLGYRCLSADILNALKTLLTRTGTDLSNYGKLLARDIAKIQGIAGSVQKARLAKKGAAYGKIYTG